MTRDGLVRENQTTGEVQSVSGRDAEQNLSPAAQEDLPVSAAYIGSPSDGRMELIREVIQAVKTMM